MAKENEVKTAAPDVNKNTQLATRELSHSERFTNAIEREFISNAGELNITRFQKKLCQNYFIKIDMILKDTEKKRLAKGERYRESLPYTWENINLPKLAVDVITFSSVGLDPAQPNHINPIPYKNNSSNKYDLTFIIGYRGVELKAKKYGLDIPDDVVVELVYSNDKFKQIKKDIANEIEGYNFEIVNDFDRGEVVGGFYYHKYFDNPEKNKLRVFSMKDILKRKPPYAAPEFWGGEKDKWEYDEASGKNKKVGKEQVDGWFDEMCYKTVCRAAYNSITIDSEKIDENYLAVVEREKDSHDYIIYNEIAENANKKEIGFDETAAQNGNVNGNAKEAAPAEKKEPVQPPKPEIKSEAKEEKTQPAGQQVPSPTLDF